MMQPVCRRTWAPRGQTPVLNCWSGHERLSAVGAVTLAPWSARAGMYFEVMPRNVTADDLVSFLHSIHKRLRRPLIVVWDRWPVHRKAARLMEESGCDWVQFEWLPAYAPELDPAEYIWCHAKYCDLANFVPDDFSHLYTSVVASLESQRSTPSLLRSFFAAADLSI